MIEETAQVVALEQDFAWVETQRKSACGSCAASSGCGTATLQKVLGNRRSRIKALNNLPIVVGDQVVIGLEEQALIKGSIAVYAMPLLAMLGGALLLELMFASEGLTVLGGLMGLMLGFWWLKGFSRRVQSDRQYQAVVMRKADAGSCQIDLHNIET